MFTISACDSIQCETFSKEIIIIKFKIKGVLKRITFWSSRPDTKKVPANLLTVATFEQVASQCRLERQSLFKAQERIDKIFRPSIDHAILNTIQAEIADFKESLKSFHKLIVKSIQLIDSNDRALRTSKSLKMK